MTTLSPVLDKGYFFEGARWHDGRLWVSDFFGHQVVSADTRGEVTGAQGNTLFLCVAPDFSAELRSAAAESHVVTVAVDVPA
jgi:hypothetical protein